MLSLRGAGHAVWGVLLWCATVSLVCAAEATVNESAVDTTFDHFTTGFPLTGQHIFTPCESCHIDGVFKGVPRDCDGCHDGVSASGKPLTHIVTIEQCDVCHTTQGFVSSALMDHSIVGSNCIACHDGAAATGKTPAHIATSDKCAACHSTAAWIPAIFVDHSEVLGTCISCHNGNPIIGKPRGHIASSDVCDACHTVTEWKPARTVAHQEAIGACVDCHNNRIATGKPRNHAPTTDNCQACHGTIVWVPVNTVDHDQVFAAGCSACHGRKEIGPLVTNAQSQPLDHIPTTDECDTCHNTTAFIPVNFSHSGIVNNCVACHTLGIRATSQPPTHIATTTQCEACHQSTVSFAPVAASNVDHSQVLGVCSSCHNGFTATGKPDSHLPTTEECDVCHTVIAWSLGAVDHSLINSGCVTCHNGLNASGKSGTHLASTDECQLCHDKAPALWAPVQNAAVDHDQVLGTCVSCHNGSPYSGKLPNHINTSDDCDACHERGPLPWAPVAPNAVDHTQVRGTCMGCHDGNIATGQDANHIPTVDDCGACHSTAQWLPAAVDHTAIVDNCVSCHDGNSASGKSPLHMPTSNQCQFCHDKFPTPWFPVADNRVDHSQITAPCGVCHDGKVASGKSATHFATTDRCEACHQAAPVPWAPVAPTAVDHTQVLGRCDSCHDGVRATGKIPTHVPTSDDCGSCHSTAQWKPAVVDHSAIVDNCISCHDGINASGKGATHIPSTDACWLCHDKSPIPWFPVLPNRVDHTQTIGATCVSCHNGTLAGGKGATHASTTDVCDACHAPGPVPWAPLPGLVDHRELTPGMCNECHAPVAIQALVAAPGQPADHIPTTASCDLCHNITAWLPATFTHDKLAIVDNCVLCHTVGIRATAKPATHLPTSNICEACHINFIAWIPVAKTNVDHGQVIGTCSSCHNGVLASGKSATHFPTTQECDVCHDTAAWIPATGVDHTGFVGNCITCHNGTNASGKSPAHIRSSDQCDKCHDLFPAKWIPVPVAQVDHNEVAGTCVSCHNGATASGRSPTHIRTSDVCDACHQRGPVPWKPVAPAAVNHSQVIGVCSSCHDGVIASGKKLNHVPTIDECNICHSTQAWLPAAIDHIPIIDNCISCHNTVIASGKSNAHIATTDQCQLCHSKFPQTWVPVAANRVDHTQTQGTCSSCHNNVSAKGKSPTHIVTNDECDICHTTASWVLSLTGAPDHTSFSNNCVSCHNTVIASGKSPLHIATTDVCDACHDKFPSLWKPVVVNRVDHSQVIGACFSCHNGTVASGKSANHATTTNECLACHSPGPAPWIPLPGLVDHTQVAQGKCNECHGLAIVAAAVAPGQPLDHIPTTASCDLCHLISAWVPSTFTHDKLAIVDNCVLCHTPGVRATSKSAAHIASTGICEACHSGFSAWAPLAAAAVDHSQTIGTCSSCHNGVAARGKSATHIATAAECDTCHVTGTWLLTGGAPDHSAFSNNCFTCHNGTVASGKSPSHIASSTVCDACHDKFPALWKPVLSNRVDHTQVTGVCSSCHTKPATHINTTNLCDNCHEVGPAPWKPVAPAAVDHTQVLGTCSSCHNGVSAGGKPAGHIPTTSECDLCHSSNAWTPTVVPDHTAFVGNCFSCHNGTNASGKSPAHIASSNACDSCHDKYPAAWKPVAPNRVDHTQVIGLCSACHTRPLNHINTTNVCDACHAAGPVPWKPVAANAVDHNEVIGTCSSCHNGVSARGKPNGHIPTTAECDLCHSTNNWNSVTVIDHSGFVGNCITCHDGTTASGKSAQHISTTNLCDACHNKYPAGWRPVSPNRVDHTQVVGPCASCHNKPGGHINTSNLCDACHAVGPAPWAPVVTVDHSQVLGSCSSCHNGSTARGKSATHVPTADECDTCHNTTTWLGATVNHANIFDNCVSCHNGTFASGKNGGHIATTDNCELCHNKAPQGWAPAQIVNHNEILTVGCFNCHSLPSGHCDTGGLDCDSCHTAPTTSPARWANNFADCPTAPAPAPGPGPAPAPTPGPAPAPAPGGGGGAMGGGGMGGGGGGGMGGGGGGGGGMGGGGGGGM